jgi:hypothetical protein
VVVRTWPRPADPDPVEDLISGELFRFRGPSPVARAEAERQAARSRILTDMFFAIGGIQRAVLPGSEGDDA